MPQKETIGRPCKAPSSRGIVAKQEAPAGCHRSGHDTEDQHSVPPMYGTSPQGSYSSASTRRAFSCGHVRLIFGNICYYLHVLPNERAGFLSRPARREKFTGSLSTRRRNPANPAQNEKPDSIAGPILPPTGPRRYPRLVFESMQHCMPQIWVLCEDLGSAAWLAAQQVARHRAGLEPG